MNRKLLVGIFIVSLIITSVILTGCAQPPQKAEMHESEISPEGVILEDFLPEDTMMVMTINTQDEDQKDKIQTLFSYFPQEDSQKLFEQFTKELNEGLKEANLNYEEDIKPLIGDSHRLLFGMAGELENEDKDPDMYVALTVQDPQKTEELMQKIADENEDFEMRRIRNNPGLISADEEMYLVLFKDALLMTNSEQKIQEAVQRIDQNQASLLSNQNYMVDAGRTPKPNLGYVFINLAKLLETIEKSEELQKESNIKSTEALKSIKNESIVFFAEEEGIKMLALVEFDPESELFNLAQLSYEEPYMFENIPGDNLIMYAEGANLQQLLELELSILLAEEDLEEFEDFKEEFKAMVGLDFDQDIMSWMDKGFAMVLQGNQGLVPGFSLYVDASSNTEGAQKVVDVIDAAISQGLQAAYANGSEDLPIDKILTKDTVTLGGNEVHRIRFDISGLSAEELRAAALPEGIFDEPVEFYYGLTGEDYFIFSTVAGLNNKYGAIASVAENPRIIEAQSMVEGYPFQLTYFSIEEGLVYAEEFISLMEAVQGPIPDDVREGFDKVAQYLEPVKYLVGANKKSEESVAEGLMFIKIENPNAAETSEEADETEEDTEERSLNEVEAVQ